MPEAVNAIQPSIGIEAAVSRDQLMERRRRLRTAAGAGANLAALIRDVDAALERLEGGSFGSCELCHDPIEADRLLADPTVGVCLGCLSEEEQRALENDLELAARVQRALLPGRNLEVAGWELHLAYRPLAAVSGDFCDVIRADSDHELFFVFGDVSGKGVSAAMLMAHLHAVFRSLTELELALDELMARANHLFCGATLASSFATLVAGRLSSTGRLEICNAGHCPPLLMRGNELIEIRASGLPLGLFASSRFNVEDFDLGADDRLLLYTDGISEAVDENDREYGQRRLRPIMRSARGESAESTARASLSDLALFSGGAPRNDDLSLFVIRRLGI